MTKEDLINDPNSCLNKAADNEPVFLLRAQDVYSPNLVRQWAMMSGMLLGFGHPKVRDALTIAERMEEWGNRKTPD